MENLIVLMLQVTAMNAPRKHISSFVATVMHPPVKKRQAYSRHSFACFCAAFLLLICMPGCALYSQPPDPLAEWHVYLGVVPPQITEDYQEFINKLPTREQQFVNGETFYKDDV